ncbi:TAXI family TRAP transporter solute-binding subunit [Dapis sp. BLCC M126]|uniref:TAXI family TRAP transporter solute-binding subunit n=1 Tax=Dapis sp. BLCC M126 TaxID=3400189 RepID=UPI003CFAEF90
MKYQKKRPSKLIGIGGILLGAIAVTSCTPQYDTLILSSGPVGRDFEPISQKIINSARDIGNMPIDNYNSKGSQENLQRLLNQKTDLALVQLDVAAEAMKAGKVEAIAVLGYEYLHFITLSDSGINTFKDLEGKRVAFGIPGSGTYFTIKRLLNPTNLKVIEEELSLEAGLKKLEQQEIDAVIYLSPLGGSKKLQAELGKPSTLKLVPFTSSFSNFLAIKFPESYSERTIPKGIYMPLLPMPEEDIPTISTAIALVTRPDISKEKIALLTWSIISSSRQYSLFYPELAYSNDVEALLSNGLLYPHPGSIEAYNEGDPRQVLVRYLQENEHLQYSVIITGIASFLLRFWRRRKNQKLIRNSRLVLNEITCAIETNPNHGLEEVEELRRQHRLMLIEGNLPREVYQKLEDMTQVVVEKYQTIQAKQHQKNIQETIELIAECKNNAISPAYMKDKLEQSENKYQKMLLSSQIDLQTYIILTELINHYINSNNIG